MQFSFWNLSFANEFIVIFEEADDVSDGEEDHVNEVIAGAMEAPDIWLMKEYFAFGVGTENFQISAVLEHLTRYTVKISLGGRRN